MQNPANKRAAGREYRLGSASEVDFRINPGRDIRAIHALIRIDGGTAHLHARGSVRLHGQPVRDVELREGDLLQVGRDQLLRVRIPGELGGPIAFDPAGKPARAPSVDRGSPARVIAGVIAFVVLVGSAALVVQATRPDERATERQHTATSIRRMRAEVNRKLGAVERTISHMDRGVDARVARAVSDSPGLLAARVAVDKLQAAERVIATCGGSVCVIQGAYGFGREVDGKWRFLRESGEPTESGSDTENVPLSLDTEGPIFKVEYTGTGFLVDRKGLVLSNRHIAEPWWKNEAAAPILNAGYEARFLYLRAYFPERTKPIRFDPAESLTSQDADLAILVSVTKDVELPAPLKLSHRDSVPSGRSILLLGYPSGLSALLARVDEDEADRLSRQEPFDPVRILDVLAKRGFVRPLPTQGHVNDLVAGKLLFDAPSAVGGSGAPVLDMDGEVIAVNYGILKAFSGANFGVPVRFARPLLERARRLRSE